MPPLEVEEWIQGKTDEMNPWGDGKVYLLDLWGTWCLPCIRLMPRLSDLQDEYRDRGLVIVGYSWEEPAAIREFVAERRSQIRYALATDSQERTMQVLSEAEVIEGFPYAFLVDGQGIVRWKGPGQDAERAVVRFFDGPDRGIENSLERPARRPERIYRQRQVEPASVPLRIVIQAIDVDAGLEQLLDEAAARVVGQPRRRRRFLDHPPARIPEDEPTVVVGLHPESPLVHAPVVESAQQHQVLELRLAAGAPVVDVVGVAVRQIAAGEAAGLVPMS